MSEKKECEVTCNYHYHYMVPVGMAPMGVMPGMAPGPGMSDMYGSMCPRPGMPDPFDPMDPVTAGAFIGFPFFSPFFSPFFPPFFFRRRFFPFFPFFFPPFF